MRPSGFARKEAVPSRKGNAGRQFFGCAVAVLVALGAALLSPSPSNSTAEAAVSDAVIYATQHWNWSVFDNSKPPVPQFSWQDQFQCAEFVARSLAAAGQIGPLSPISPPVEYATIVYAGKSYDLLYVPSLYQFLLDTGLGTDIGTSPASASIGSVVIYGNFEHVAIVTNTNQITAHNQAMLNYPIGQIYNGSTLMPISHVVNINYPALASGALSSQVTPSSGPVTTIAPAPYNGQIVTSQVILSWQPVPGASSYNVAVYDVRNNLIIGASTAATSFTINTTVLPFGAYNYTLQPIGLASFRILFDTFNYEPTACLNTPNALSCGSGSGEGIPSASTGAVTISTVGPPGQEVAEHLVGGDAQDVEALPGRLVGQGVGEMTFPNPGLTADQDVAPLADEGTGRQVEDLLTVDAGVEAEVESLQGLGGGDVAPPHPQVELLLVASLDLVLDEAGEELAVGPLLGDGLLGAHLQRVEDPREAQALELGGELMIAP